MISIQKVTFGGKVVKYEAKEEQGVDPEALVGTQDIEGWDGETLRPTCMVTDERFALQKHMSSSEGMKVYKAREKRQFKSLLQVIKQEMPVSELRC